MCHSTDRGRDADCSAPSRTDPDRHRKGFQSFLQTDAYTSYRVAVRTQGFIHPECLAHARRKFNEVIKSHGKPRKEGLTEQTLVQTQALYRIEKVAHP